MHPVPVCSGLVCWPGWLVGVALPRLEQQARPKPRPKPKQKQKWGKKHLTVSLFGIHCEFKGRLSDRNNKEARSGSADVNAAAAAAAAAVPQKRQPQRSVLKGVPWSLVSGFVGAIMGHGPWSPCGRCVLRPVSWPAFDSV